MQQPSPSPSHTASPLTMPKAFRRTTGAHDIIVSILLADLLGFLVWVLLGAFIWPPIWWLLRAFLHLLHASLGFDLALVLVLCCLAIGLLLDAWAIPGTLLVLTVGIVCMLCLIQPEWLMIPSPLPAFVPQEAPSWRLVVVPQGADIAAGLCLLAHVLVLRRTQTETMTQPLSLSRAHPDDPLWLLVEQAYALYRQALTRFHPSPISTLKTPSTFYYYQKQARPDTQVPPDPEQEMYWHNGNLVLNQEYLSRNEEQAHTLLPLLARLLAGNTVAALLVNALFRFAHIARRTWLTTWLLAVPLFVQERCEQHWNRQERERILDGDWFAYACGEGPRLRRLLRTHLEERTLHHLPDHAIPTLTERINHLSSLLYREELQVQQLRETVSLTPPTPERNVLHR